MGDAVDVDGGVDLVVGKFLAEADGFEEFRGRDEVAGSERIFDLLAEKAGRDFAAVGGVVFEPDVEAVGGPGFQRGIFCGDGCWRDRSPLG